MGFGDPFLLMLSPTGARLYATFLGGAIDEVAFGLGLTSSGAAYLAGMTRAGGTAGILGGAADVFVMSVSGLAPGSSTGPVIDSVMTNAGQRSVIAPNTWIEIKGRNLAPRERLWGAADFVNGQMPVELDGVRVTVNGRPAFVYYISDKQVNVLAPLDSPTSGSAIVQLRNASGTSSAVNVPAQSVAPGFFQFGGTSFVAATHANGALLGPATLYPGLSTPGQPGETVILYGAGFGQPSAPLTNGSAMQAGSLPAPPVIRIGGIAAEVLFAGVISPGLYQFNILIPLEAPEGDQPVTATFGGSTTQTGATIAIRR
jgi:uncharacterized protein (TIGR03437 family)